MATELELGPEQIDIRTPFSDFGLDSRTAVRMSGDLERKLGRRLSPTLFWDFPTIEVLARHLHSGEPSPIVADDCAASPSQWDEA
jgi:acyl carrier protein